jgi:hypothetical protein
MNRTPDGNKYWLDITGLDPNTTYAFQYSIDLEDMRIADPYTEMVLDPWNDPWIPASTFPNIPTYPRCSTTQIASAFRINEETHNWTDASYVRPPAERLVVYELLVRDFIAARNYETLIDTLDYLDNLGVTAIELMPVNEFEGNDSWGYNTSFFFALDKAYGTKQALKTFVNECHNRGIAVVMDIRKKDKFYPLHEDQTRIMREIGFELDEYVIWDRQRDYNNMKTLGYPYVYRFNRVHEFICIYLKAREVPIKDVRTPKPKKLVANKAVAKKVAKKAPAKRPAKKVADKKPVKAKKTV